MPHVPDGVRPFLFVRVQVNFLLPALRLTIDQLVGRDALARPDGRLLSKTSVEPV